jgi:putative NIF3 family GTP cyclohydrolase 1 type 2
VLRLAQHNIAVYSPHTSVDAVLGGVNDWLASILNKVHAAHEVAVTVVQPITGRPVPAGFEGAGYGRRVQLALETDIESIMQLYCVELGLKHVSVSRPRRVKGGERHCVRTVAVCAGSGYDVLKDTDADLIVTGEMSHHNALRLKMLGKSVITLFHSNSERGFLKQVLQAQLEEELRKEDKEAEVLVSEEDADPFEIFDAGYVVR